MEIDDINNSRAFYSMNRNIDYLFLSNTRTLDEVLEGVQNQF